MDQIWSRQSSRLLVALLISGLTAALARPQAPGASPATPSPGVTATPAASQPAGPRLLSPESADKVVLKVGDQQFTKADIDFLISNLPPQTQRSLETQGKKQLGDQFALIVMLSQQAHLHHLDQSPAFVQKLAMQKEQLEAQAAYEEINQQANVTPEEVNQYYTAHAASYDEIMLRQFVIRIKPSDAKTDPARPTPATGAGLAPEDAKARAEAIRKEVIAGTDIKKVIEDFRAPGDVIIEAEPRKVRRGGMRPEMEKVAFALKDGEISEPLDLPQALVLLQVSGHTHVELKDVSPEIEKSLKKEKTDAALAAVKKNTTLWMDEQYFAPPPKPKPAGGPTLGLPPGNPPPKP